MKVWLFGSWILILAIGVGAFAQFSYTPGQAADASTAWPSLSRLQPAENQPELLVFLHPKCACSHATLKDLGSILPEIGSRAKVRVIFNDLGDPSLLEESHSYEMAKEMASESGGIEIVKDPNGVESKLFGVKTSGQVFLYDEQAKLVFSGGLTPSRGHEGESQGAIAVMSWLNSKKIQWQTSNVFGCSMKVKL